MKRFWAVAIGIAAAGLLAAGIAQAAINPSLQPVNLYRDLYTNVLAGKVAAVDEVAKTFTLDVTQVFKGPFDAKQVTVTATGADLDEILSGFSQGQIIVAYVGKPRKRHEGDILFYSGEGKWQEGQLASLQDLSKWNWTDDTDKKREREMQEQPQGANADEKMSEMTMFATFNGEESRLAEMMEDTKTGRVFYPSKPYIQFRDDLVIGTFAAPVHGVALYDIDGDGRLDIYACSEAGNRVYLQKEPMKFVDATAALKLEGVKGTSCNFADVNADGRADLLVDGVIYLQAADGTFARSDLLPADVNRNIKSSAFVEVNGDGYPDVVISQTGGGLHVYLNQGPKGGPFTDATQAMGLDTKECGAGLDGFFAPGDWNGDGLTDIFYAAGKGFLLVQDGKGRFKPLAHRVEFNFESGGDGEMGKTGAGVFAPIWTQDTLALAIPEESEMMLAADLGGTVTDVSGYANETSEAGFKQLLTIAEDLNADGYVDLYTSSWEKIQPAFAHVYRGYGSFMRPEKYKADVFYGKAHNGGAWGAAAGDIDGDGANDLVIGGVDGTLSLIINDTLSLRQPGDNLLYDEQKLLNTAILTVRVLGKIGVLGAKVTLADAAGRVVGRRDIGSNVATGCRGPDTMNLAVIEPGKHVLTVRFSDGAVRRWTMDLAAGKHVTMDASRDDTKAETK